MQKYKCSLRHKRDRYLAKYIDQDCCRDFTRQLSQTSKILASSLLSWVLIHTFSQLSVYSYLHSQQFFQIHSTSPWFSYTQSGHGILYTTPLLNVIGMGSLDFTRICWKVVWGSYGISFLYSLRILWIVFE